MNEITNYNNALNYDDVFIIPKYSMISSRKQVDLSFSFSDIKIKVPIMPANMFDITSPAVARATFLAGGLGCLHRFCTIDEAVRDFNEVKDCHGIFTSVGVNRDSQERFQALYNVGARHFIIDIAHGHSWQMNSMIQWIKTNYSDAYVVAGNVATPDAVKSLIEWGTDGIKIGIGPGAVCLTKNVTGVTVPQFTAVAACAAKAREEVFRLRYEKNVYNKGNPRDILVIADGGVREIGDICKAIGAGADIVMAGGIFAGCDETPSFQTKKYSGSASREIQTTYRTDQEYVPTPEGMTTSIERKGPIAGVINDIAGGLKSAYSYVGAPNTTSFMKYCKFGIRHNK